MTTGSSRTGGAIGGLAVHAEAMAQFFGNALPAHERSFTTQAKRCPRFAQTVDRFWRACLPFPRSWQMPLRCGPRSIKKSPRRVAGAKLQDALRSFKATADNHTGDLGCLDDRETKLDQRATNVCSAGRRCRRSAAQAEKTMQCGKADDCGKGLRGRPGPLQGCYSPR